MGKMERSVSSLDDPTVNLTCNDRLIVIESFFAGIIAFAVQQ